MAADLAKRSEAGVTGYYFSPRLHQSSAPFSHFVQHGDTGYTAGIIGQDPHSGALVSDDVTEQCAAMLTKRLHAPFPARTTIQVAALPLGAKVQIEPSSPWRSQGKLSHDHGLRWLPK